MNKVYKISLFPLILACVSAMPAGARVTTKNSNRSYADAYQQVNALRYQQETANATTASSAAKLPVMVSDEKLAKDILNGTAENVAISDLEACSMIYPSGVFKWEIPESGVRRNQISQCVAVVELRNANTNAVLATTTVAAGDTFKCNADSFPESGLSFDLKYGKVEVPADAAPTMEDVISVMNEEQRQNAGFKIAAGAIIGGVAGNLLGQKQAGDTKLFGTGQTQLIDTAIGTATGAGIMAASSYSGKVAGDTIKSTAVNAASGMILGNMLAGASGDNAVIATSKCSVIVDETTKKTEEKDCIPGVYYLKEETAAINGGHNYVDNTSTTPTDWFFVNKTNVHDMLKCQKDSDGIYNECQQVSSSQYVDIQCKKQDGAVVFCSTLSANDKRYLDGYAFIEDSKTLKAQSTDSKYIPVESAYKVQKRFPAYVVFDKNLEIKPLGYNVKEWESLKTKDIKFYNRESDGSVGPIVNEVNNYEFEPSTRDAGDGALVDINNQARAKATIAGTAAGGALGGFAGYQGAQDEVTQRWVSAVREYEDSLSNFGCYTGGRFLSKYNDYVEIPELKKTEQ